MKAFIDGLLDRVTMYRLMLYYLSALIAGAVVLSVLGVMPYRPADIIGTTALLILFSWLFNWFFATLFHVKQNPESRFITALILALIMRPVYLGMESIVPLFAAALVAAGTKYVFAHDRMHVFNPAAIGAFAAALLFGQGSSWWVGNPALAPLILLGGLLVAYKIKRLRMVGLFLGTFVITTVVAMGVFLRSADAAAQLIAQPLVFAPILFFAFVMLVEPLTSPQPVRVQYRYAVLIGVLAVAYGYSDLTFPYALELALLSGNLFTRAVAFNPRVTLTLRRREDVAHDTVSFWFEPSHPVMFVPGQFMQWELPHRHSDNRGTRRFFTICSSPTEPWIMVTTKFSEPSSTFKAVLRTMQPPDTMTGMDVEGAFTLPPESDPTPCVFIAGGIGVTPFRSMIKYMLDKKLSRPITLLYSAKTADAIAFKQLFDEAGLVGWLKTVYTITESIPYGWRGRTGYITADIIKEEVPDYEQRLFYLSGPQPMVSAFVALLSDMGIPQQRIRTDYFPGYVETHQAKEG